jgi:hypothetical protein
MPKDHFCLLKFANFRPSSYLAPEKPDHETHTNMHRMIGKVYNSKKV